MLSGKFRTFNILLFAHFPEPTNCQVDDLVHLEHIERQIYCHDCVLETIFLVVKYKCVV